tara:strand:- start:302 stop:613 length:312 start_codon:yes stop_codon:yes gene_type:complete
MVVNYSQTHIYSLESLNNTNEKFILFSPEINRRIVSHKYCCNNSSSSEYNRKIYKHIRSNGGIENWTFKLLKFIPCKTRKEAELMLDLFILDIKQSSDCIILN